MTKLDKPELDSTQAKLILEQDAKNRCELAAKELNALCDKYNVNIVAVCQIVNQNINQAIQFVSR